VTDGSGTAAPDASIAAADATAATGGVPALQPGAPLVEVTRRDARQGIEVIESVHSGHLAVVGGDGEVRGAIGDPWAAIFTRSAVKPFQATACLELLGAHDRPSDAELAVAWSSHRAEPRHLAAVRALLARSGTDPDALTCPPAVGDADPGAVPTRLRHNCSGKHALFALAGHRLGCPRGQLLDPDGPLQHHVLGVLTEVLGRPLAVGVDGCGAPAVVVPLNGLARAFADLAVSPRFEAVRRAGVAQPGLVGGEGRLESALLAAGVVAKVGAEGVFAAGWRDADGAGRGIAVKVADGAARAANAATAAVLVGLGVVAPDRWRDPPPLGGGRPQGEVRAVTAVRELARRLSTPG
jgi:L-asparaginase II